MQTSPRAQVIANQANLIFPSVDRSRDHDLEPEDLPRLLESARWEMTQGDPEDTEAETGLTPDEQEAAALMAAAWVLLRRAAHKADDESLEWANPTE